MSDRKQIKPENKVDSMKISSSAPETASRSYISITSQRDESSKNISNEADLSQVVHENPTAVFNEIVELYKRNIGQLPQRVGSQADLGTTRIKGGQVARIKGCYH